MGKDGIQLRVADARQRDVGHGKVRIDNETMKKLNATAGDFVEIHGKKVTTAVVWPAYTEDQGQDTIRMDGLLRRNAGVALNEYINKLTIEFILAWKRNKLNLFSLAVFHRNNAKEFTVISFSWINSNIRSEA